MLDRLDT